MQKVTIYKINDKIYIKYKPKKTAKLEKVPEDVINYEGTLYQPIKLEDLEFEPDDIDLW